MGAWFRDGVNLGTRNNPDRQSNGPMIHRCRLYTYLGWSRTRGHGGAGAVTSGAEGRAELVVEQRGQPAGVGASSGASLGKSRVLGVSGHSVIGAAR
jgi:hypothetical protein